MKATNTFTIYDASAGSGKTFTLVKEYLKLLLTSGSDDSYKNILAITFTNKAVGEMKSRIIDSLKALSATPSGDKAAALIKILSAETNLPEEEITRKSRNILKSIIHNYAAFEISTIDGFTHRVLRSFAKDLELPLNFEVELDTEEVLSEAVDRVINKAGEDKALTRVLVSFVLTKTDDDKSWDISRDLLEIAKLLTEETSQPFVNKIKNKNLSDFQDLRKKVLQETAKREDQIIQTANRFFELIKDNGIEPGDFKGSYCPNFFKKLQKGDFPDKFDAVWQINLADDPLYAKKLAEDKKSILDQLQPGIVELFEGAKKGILEIQFLKAIEKNLVPLSLLSAIQNQIQEIKQENSILLISEFNAIIGKAVKDQPAPFIYERLGERYRHFFIDEFQDTSQLQWENLIPLADHTLSVQHTGAGFGSLTLVGDAKQSIYRWRGGKAEQFMELCRDKNPFNLEEKKVVVLPNNYRSAKSIVNFNNDFFRFSAACFQLEEHRELFLNSSQESTTPQEGYVNLSFVEAENADEEMEAYPQKVLEILNDLQEQQIRKSDVCILTRKKKESIAVANFLNEHGISVISAESLLVSRAAEVQFINAVLKFCVEPAEKNTKFEILDFLLKHSIEVEDEFHFVKRVLELEGQKFFDTLKPHGIEIQLAELVSVSIYEAVEYIIRACELVKDSNAYLQFFLDFVYEVSQSESAGIMEYLELWERKKDDLSIVVPEGENAVQIMTIHRAKGLEFPVVIYPFANSQISDTARESLWTDLPDGLNEEIPVAYLKASDKMKQWPGQCPELYEELCAQSELDALNVLYVALTRPVQQLYIISKYDLDKNGNERSGKFSGLFISYLKSIGKWDESKEYHFGNRSELLQEQGKVLENVQQQHFYSSPTQSNDISIITRAGALWDSRQKEAIEKGQLVHDLFAEIFSVDDVDQVLLTAKEKGLFKESDHEEILSMIRQVVDHEELSHLYASTNSCFNEKDMVSSQGEILRPDRINFNGNKVTIVDYKTGVEKQFHQEQITEYGQVLSEMAYEIEKKILVYINENISLKYV
ncbi:UvrD-helicase domain-containing protein [Salinimicrobium soli]|uniref:UvrD-helicase domain-containing protein n=1 Tax=Salinimicrobium soli TaxID=1254399 RepID=UPI003AAEA4CB